MLMSWSEFTVVRVHLRSGPRSPEKWAEFTKEVGRIHSPLSGPNSPGWSEFTWAELVMGRIHCKPKLRVAFAIFYA